MTDDEISNVLIGKRIVSAVSSGDGAVITFDDDTELTLMPEGDCCAHAYLFDHEDTLSHLPGKMWGGWEQREYTGDSNCGNDPNADEVVDYHRYTVMTDHGEYDFELRVSHNGYYSGHINLLYNGETNESTPPDSDAG